MMARLPCLLLLLLFWGQVRGEIQSNVTSFSTNQTGECLEATQTNDNVVVQTESFTSSSNTCSLYVAPSTISNAGLGVFTSIPLTTNQVIHDGDVILPLADLEYYQEYQDTFNPFLNYLWNSTCFGMQYEAQTPSSTSAFAPGLLSLMNTNPSFINTKRGNFKYKGYIGGQVHESPTSGSMTPYYNSQVIASTDIPAGSELFMHYGNGWFESRQQQQPSDNHTTSTRRRSTEQFQQTGRCLDSITSGESTLPFAGRGAFVTRNFSKDSIITGSPLIHVPFEHFMYLYKFYHDEAARQDLPDFDEHDGYQLAFNYCLSHSQTFMMLCPYGTGVNYINHNKTLANVKLQWSPNGTLNIMNDDWLAKSPRELQFEYNPQLSLDYIAMRDIQEGEELFLDYGNEFEEYLLEYMDDWEPVTGSKSAQHWNYEHGDEPLRDMKEQDWRLYPNALEMRCHPSVYFDTYKQLIEQDVPLEELWPNNEKGLVCDVHSRQEHDSGDITYTLLVYHHDYKTAVTRRDVTREFVTMIDRPYTTDWHRRNTFRHWIGLPDELLPEAWKLTEDDFISEEEDEEEEDFDRSEDEEEG